MSKFQDQSLITFASANGGADPFEALQRDIANWLPQLVWTCRDDGSCDYLSRRWLQYTGCSLESQLGLGWLEQVHPEDRERVFSEWGRARDAVVPYHVELRLRRYDGDYRWFDTRALPVLDDTGRLLKWFGTNTDVEEQRELRERLRVLAEELQSVLASSPGLICSYERSHTGKARFPFASPAAMDIYGVTPQQMAEDASVVFDRIHRDDLAQVIARVQASAQTMSAWSGEFRYDHPRKGERWISGLSAPRRSESGSVVWHGVVQDITERRQEQAALRDSEERFTKAFRSGPIAIAITRQSDGCVIETNERFFALTGYGAHDVLFKDASQLAISELLRGPEAASEGGGTVLHDLEISFLTKLGARRTVLASFETLQLGAEGRCVLSTFVDITERVQAERRLHAQQSIGRTLTEARSVGPAAREIARTLSELENWDFVAIWTVIGEQLVCSGAWTPHQGPEWVALTAETMAMRLGSAVGGPGRAWAERRSVWITDPGNDRELKRREVVNRAGLRTAAFFPIEHAGSASGVIELMSREVRSTQPPLEELIGAIGGQLHLFVQRIRSEEVLRESEELWRTVIQNLGEGLVMVEGDDLTRNYWNPAALEMFGAPPQGVTMTAAFAEVLEFRTLEGELVPLDERPLRQVVRGAHLRGLELRVRRTDIALERIISFSGTRVVRDGAEALAFLTVRDVTEHTKAKLELHRLNSELEQGVTARTAELEQANRELEAFSYSVSHDLRSPLRAMNGYAHVLMADYAELLPADGQRAARSIADGSKRLGQLIDDLLAFSRLGRLPLTRTRVDMQALLAEILAEPPFEQRTGVELDVQPLPSCFGDAALLRQVWVNLLSNAFKYSRGRASARITVGGKLCDDGSLVYFVRDNGAGFDMRYAGKLFRVFERLHGKKFEGTGVGLAIVQRVISRHGGRVWAEGEVDRGATFSFALPGAGARAPS